VGVTCGTHWGGENCLQVLVGRPEGKRPLGRPRRRWEDNMVCTGFSWLRIGSSDGLL
jgi:hypothetical protein